MDNYERKFQAAIEEMKNVGLRKNNSVGFLTNSLRKIGFKPRPLNYISFVGLSLGFGIYMGFLMWLFTWKFIGTPMSEAFLMALISGSIFGL